MTRKEKPSPSKTMENGSNAQPQKFCRVCWNEKGWEYPSGIYGKSKEQIYEHDAGFGVEEWLLDRAKLIKDYHYGYVHALANRKQHVGQPLDLHLFTINSATKERFWLGVIRNLIPVSGDESQKVFKIYKKKDWFSEMERQVKIAEGNVKKFKRIPAEDFFNLKFKPGDIELLDSPRQFSAQDSAVKGLHYTTLYNWSKDPETLPDRGGFEFLSGHNPGKGYETRRTTGGTKDAVLLHNQMQNDIYEQLKREYGEKNVGTEIRTATGARIDVVVRTGEKYDIYEIKTRNFAIFCIREALSQLMEYAYWSGKGEEVDRLIIVALEKLGSDGRRYLKYLREEFCIPIYYWTYDKRERCIIEEE